jgi:hypothetical protein
MFKSETSFYMFNLDESFKNDFPSILKYDIFIFCLNFYDYQNEIL